MKITTLAFLGALTASALAANTACAGGYVSGPNGGYVAKGPSGFVAKGPEGNYAYGRTYRVYPVYYRPAVPVVVASPVIYQPYPLVYRPTVVVTGSPVYVPPNAPVISVQRRLTVLGYYGGPIDGIMGPKTRTAISAYQREHGLVVTGTIDKALAKSLKL
ncbi:MAG TPA: peptidoglycan-binding protein [Chthoniobacterales bacterium]